jgi:hypothetical protein
VPGIDEVIDIFSRDIAGCVEFEEQRGFWADFRHECAFLCGLV